MTSLLRRGARKCSLGLIADVLVTRATLCVVCGQPFVCSLPRTHNRLFACYCSVVKHHERRQLGVLERQREVGKETASIASAAHTAAEETSR